MKQIAWASPLYLQLFNIIANRQKSGVQRKHQQPPDHTTTETPSTANFDSRTSPLPFLPLYVTSIPSLSVSLFPIQHLSLTTMIVSKPRHEDSQLHKEDVWSKSTFIQMSMRQRKCKCNVDRMCECECDGDCFEKFECSCKGEHERECDIECACKNESPGERRFEYDCNRAIAIVLAIAIALAIAITIAVAVESASTDVTAGRRTKASTRASASVPPSTPPHHKKVIGNNYLNISNDKELIGRHPLHQILKTGSIMQATEMTRLLVVVKLGGKTIPGVFAPADHGSTRDGEQDRSFRAFNSHGSGPWTRTFATSNDESDRSKKRMNSPQKLQGTL